MPRKHPSNPNLSTPLTDVPSSQTKKCIQEFKMLFTNTVLAFVQNSDTSLNFPVEIIMTRKVVIAAHKIIKKCNSPKRRYMNDSPEMNKIMQLMPLPELLIIQFDLVKKHIELYKIVKSPLLKENQIFFSICREDEEKFKTDFYKLVLLVLKDQTPQRYIDLGSPITEDEAKTAEDIIKWLNDRQRPVSPHTSHQQILIIDEILQILSGNPLILLTFDVSVNKRYLRIMNRLKSTTTIALTEVVFEPQVFSSYVHEMLKVFINFFQNDEKSFVLKFKTNLPRNIKKMYTKIKLFLTNRKGIVGIGSDVETINLYQQLKKAMYGGQDLGIIDKFSARLITITKEPRFMTEITSSKIYEECRSTCNLNTDSPHVDESDESDDEISDNTDTATQVDQATCDTLEDKLYQLRNDTIDNMKKFIMTINRTRDDRWLVKYARQCKFLVSLECFLRQSSKVHMNLMNEKGILVPTTFLNAVIKNFNSGTQCSFSKNIIINNLFQRLLAHDYCKLRTEYKPRKVIITKIMKKGAKTNDESTTINNVDNLIDNDMNSIVNKNNSLVEYTILLTNEIQYLDIKENEETK